MSAFQKMIRFNGAKVWGGKRGVDEGRMPMRFLREIQRERVATQRVNEALEAGLLQVIKNEVK